jgi:hypothetical protein
MELFRNADKGDVFNLAYKLAFLIGEGALTKGCTPYVPWNTDARGSEDSKFYKLEFPSAPSRRAIRLSNYGLWTN